MSEASRTNESYGDELIKRLNEKAKNFRKELLIMTTRSGSGHASSALSAVDIITALFFHQMRYNPKDPGWEDRDRFVLSKGHGCPVLYVALAEAGYFPKEELATHRKLGSILQGHPDMKTPGVEIPTGSLGQGLSAAVGMALAGKLDDKDYHVYVVLSDGELDEGNVWEAAMAAAHYKLDNITAIVDRNYFQVDGPTEEIMALNPLSDKWRAFGWNVMEIDGHNMREILVSLDEAVKMKGKPTVIIANTIKGKGVSFVEGDNKYHGKALSEEELALALKELK
ncbi:MAG: transketolase [Candidatus Bathyarchaeota archaeon]|nr:transketolase [Candidatus Bathyarchaeota archaeon]